MKMSLHERLQRAYPRIYLACHVRHVRATSNEARLSANDATLLSHLQVDVPLTPGALSQHLGVGKSTLSAHLQRLERLGYIDRRQHPVDKRTVELRLSPNGKKAMAATSVLDPDRVAVLLAQLTPADAERAVVGLELLARATQATLNHFSNEDNAW